MDGDRDSLPILTRRDLETLPFSSTESLDSLEDEDSADEDLHGFQELEDLLDDEEEQGELSLPPELKSLSLLSDMEEDAHFAEVSIF